MSYDDPTDLLVRWRQGEQQAATELFQRYTARLIALVRARLSDKLAQRLDPEDVVQSAYRSFFSHVRNGRFDLERGGDLWQFLVVVTLHKLHKCLRRNTAQKRDAHREQGLGEGEAGNDLAHFLSREPSPLEAVALADEVQWVMSRLGPLERSMLELRLQGYNQEEIATRARRSEITVRRFLKQVKEQFQRWQQEVTGGECG
jgi:RNA polymerase sigma-70 factor (ECF subfamily)